METPLFCMDNRALNRPIKADKFSISSIEEIVEDMAGAQVFSKFDVFACYWQIRLVEQVQEITTFTCKYGSFMFRVTPFELMNAPAMFQHMASNLFEHLTFVKVYIDDVVV